MHSLIHVSNVELKNISIHTFSIEYWTTFRSLTRVTKIVHNEPSSKFMSLSLLTTNTTRTALHLRDVMIQYYVRYTCKRVALNLFQQSMEYSHLKHVQRFLHVSFNIPIFHIFKLTKRTASIMHQFPIPGDCVYKRIPFYTTFIPIVSIIRLPVTLVCTLKCKSFWIMQREYQWVPFDKHRIYNAYHKRLWEY